MPNNGEAQTGSDGWKFLAGAVAVGSLAMGALYVGEQALSPKPPSTIATTSSPRKSAELRVAALACNSSPLEQVRVDCDNDGLGNVIDRQPLTKDLIDVDGDGIPNMRDPRPYVKDQYNFNVNTFQPTNTVKPKITPTPPVTIYNPYEDLVRDEDGDMVPDYIDNFDGNDYGDSDSDGVSNARDPRPYDSDRDGDGDPDGYDKYPTDPNRGRQAEQRLQEERERERAEQARRDLEAADRRREENRQR